MSYQTMRLVRLLHFPDSMRDRLPTSRETIEALRNEVAELKRRVSDTFSVEEMDAIREQLAERAACAEQAREEIEWSVRVELSRVREAEAAAMRAAGEMRKVAVALATLLGEEESIVPVRTKVGRRLFA